MAAAGGSWKAGRFAPSGQMSLSSSDAISSQWQRLDETERASLVSALRSLQGRSSLSQEYSEASIRAFKKSGFLDVSVSKSPPYDTTPGFRYATIRPNDVTQAAYKGR